MRPSKERRTRRISRSKVKEWTRGNSGMAVQPPEEGSLTHSHDVKWSSLAMVLTIVNPHHFRNQEQNRLGEGRDPLKSPTKREARKRRVNLISLRQTHGPLIRIAERGRVQDEKPNRN